MSKAQATHSRVREREAKGLRHSLRNANAFASVAQTSNQFQIGNYLDAIGPAATGDLATVFSAIDSLTGADGKAVYRSRPLLRTGVYHLSTGSSVIPIAVNPPAEEADIRTIDDASIKHALGDIDVDLQSDQLPPL